MPLFLLLVAIAVVVVTSSPSSSPVSMTMLVSAQQQQLPATSLLSPDGTSLSPLEFYSTSTQPIPLFCDATKFQSPVPDPGKISNTFGPRWQSGRARYDFHRGIDYFDKLDTPISAIADGTVYELHNVTHGSYPGGGNVVILEHAVTPSSVANSGFHGATLAKFWSYYFHLNTIESSLTPGAAITKGALVGRMGNTSIYATTIHLHFEIRLQGRCSYEFQVSSGKSLPQPSSTCYTGYDPHVHPFLFVGGNRSSNDAASKRIQQIQPLNSSFSVAIRYNTTKGHLDLDVINTNFGSISIDLRRLTRPGLPNTTYFTTLEQLDDLQRIAPFMVVIPGTFNRYTTQDEIYYDFHFWSSYSSGTTTTAAQATTTKSSGGDDGGGLTFFEAIDIYGDAVRWTNSSASSSGTSSATTAETTTTTAAAAGGTTTTTAAVTASSSTTAAATGTPTTTSASTTTTTTTTTEMASTTASGTSSTSASGAPTTATTTSTTAGTTTASPTGGGGGAAAADDDDDGNTPAIAGGAGGGGFILLCIVVYFVARRTKKDEERENNALKQRQQSSSEQPMLVVHSPAEGASKAATTGGSVAPSGDLDL